jgi:hypothetical protein
VSSKGQETAYDRRLLCKVKKRRQRKRGARQCARQGQESAYGENWIAAWLARLGNASSVRATRGSVAAGLGNRCWHSKQGLRKKWPMLEVRVVLGDKGKKRLMLASGA